MTSKKQMNIAVAILAGILAMGAAVATSTVPVGSPATASVDQGEVVARIHQRLLNDRTRTMRSDGSAGSRWFESGSYWSE